MSLETLLNEMAEELVQAAKGEMPVKDKVDIFKATSNWALGVMKKKPADDDTAGTFDTLRNKINGATTQ